MKIRIENNDIRVRLNKPEVIRFAEGGKIEGETLFGLLPSQRLRYVLIKDESINEISPSYEPQLISIKVPSRLVEEWAKTDLVSLERHVILEKNNALCITIEKDFKRLSRRHVKDPDAYPHPLERT